jgi:hypothetical protein
MSKSPVVLFKDGLYCLYLPCLHLLNRYQSCLSIVLNQSLKKTFLSELSLSNLTPKQISYFQLLLHIDLFLLLDKLTLNIKHPLLILLLLPAIDYRLELFD